MILHTISFYYKMHANVYVYLLRLKRYSRIKIRLVEKKSVQEKH